MSNRIKNFVKNLTEEELKELKELINKSIEITNEQSCKFPVKGKKWCNIYKGICKCKPIFDPRNGWSDDM